MTYLWRRPSGWTFQARVPARFVNRFGATPFRVRLGPLPAFEARRRARILAGALAIAMEGNDVEKGTVQRSLAALAAELEALSGQERLAGLRASTARGQWKQFFAEAERELGSHEGVRFDPQTEEHVAYFRETEAAHKARSDALADVRQRLAAVGAALAEDGAAWEGERTAYAAALATVAQATAAAPVPEAPPWSRTATPTP